MYKASKTLQIYSQHNFSIYQIKDLLIQDQMIAKLKYQPLYFNSRFNAMKEYSLTLTQSRAVFILSLYLILHREDENI